MAKPKVFVSSTYYDLKYIRNNLKSFITQYGFEPILNEFGTITYDPTKPLDKSCYNEAKQCDIFILIIGGRYGSVSSDQEIDKEKLKDFYEEYVSITRQEYRTAYENSIPIYVFVDKNVYSEFRTYLKNKDKNQVEYAYVDSINVYKFIEEAESKFTNNIICSFERFEDIEEWLKEQWAGMFKNYLTLIKEKKEEKKITNSIDKLEMLAEQMNTMLNEVGKKVLVNNGEYDEVVREQSQKLVEFYAKNIVDNITFSKERYTILDNDESNQIVDVLFDEFLDKPFEQLFTVVKGKVSLNTEVLLRINEKLKTIEEELSIKKINYIETYEIYNKEIKPILEKYGELIDVFKDNIRKQLEDLIDIF